MNRYIDLLLFEMNKYPDEQLIYFEFMNPTQWYLYVCFANKLDDQFKFQTINLIDRQTESVDYIGLTY